LAKPVPNTNRLKIIVQMVQGERSPEQPAVLLDDRAPTTSHHPCELAALGLVHSHAAGTYYLNRLELAPIRSLAERMLAVDALPALAADVDHSVDKKVFADLSDSSG
jgi:hypothetical protein